MLPRDRLFKSQDDWLTGPRWNPICASSKSSLPVSLLTTSLDRTSTLLSGSERHSGSVGQRDQNSADGGENLSIAFPSNRLWQSDTHQGTDLFSCNWKSQYFAEWKLRDSGRGSWDKGNLTNDGWILLESYGSSGSVCVLMLKPILKLFNCVLLQWIYFHRSVFPLLTNSSL